MAYQKKIKVRKNKAFHNIDLLKIKNKNCPFLGPISVILIHCVGPQATPVYSQSWEAAALGKLQDYPDKDCLQENCGADGVCWLSPTAF